MGKVGRDHWRSPRPTSLLRQSLLEHDIKVWVQIAFLLSPGKETRTFNSEELCCFPKTLMIFTQQSLPVHPEESSFGKKVQWKPRSGMRNNLLTRYYVSSSWTEKELNCCPKSSLSDYVDWVDDLSQDRFPTDYRGISEHWVSSSPKIMGSLKIMPCNSRATCHRAAKGWPDFEQHPAGPALCESQYFAPGVA